MFFSFLLIIIVTLGIKDGQKRVSLFPKEVKNYVRRIKLLKLLIVRYAIAIVINVSFLLLIHHYRSINIAINQYFNVLLQPY